MPLSIDFTALIVEWDALETHYPGGVEAFCKRNRYFSRDWYLVGINRMTCKDPKAELAHLVENGVPENSIAMLNADGCLAEPRDWLVSGEINGHWKAWFKDEMASLARKADGTAIRHGPKDVGGLTVNPPGTPLPDGHPFKNPSIIFLPSKKR